MLKLSICRYNKHISKLVNLIQRHKLSLLRLLPSVSQYNSLRTDTVFVANSRRFLPRYSCRRTRLHTGYVSYSSLDSFLKWKCCSCTSGTRTRYGWPPVSRYLYVHTAVSSLSSGVHTRVDVHQVPQHQSLLGLHRHEVAQVVRRR